jgi:carbon monoxide dehydrogenase subunit G
MELEHSFTVPVPRSRAWDVLLDVERVAPCMPGATIDSVDGDEIRGKIKVKVGPINMTYAGTARFIERDEQAGVVTLEASGKETRGAGTASASVHSVLEDRGDETHVTVRTTLNVTGRPAQFGRGVMNEVGGRLLTIFATNLAAMLSKPDGEAGAPAETTQPAAESAVSAGAVGSDGAKPDRATSAPSAEASTAAASDTPVDDLKLPPRAVSSLHRENITTAGQLAKKSEDELLAIDGIGPASVVDIKTKLTDLGLQLGPPAAAAPTASAAASPPSATQPSADGTPAARQAAPAPAAVTPHTSTAREAAHQFEDDAINLLKVAGMPVLKRALPVIAALAAALLIGLRRKARRRHS